MALHSSGSCPSPAHAASSQPPASRPKSTAVHQPTSDNRTAPQTAVGHAVGAAVSTAVTTAMGAAALSLAGTAPAEATLANSAPQPEAATWTLAQATSLSSATTPAAGFSALNYSSRWASVVGQVAPSSRPNCCFSSSAQETAGAESDGNSIGQFNSLGDLGFGGEAQTLPSQDFYLLLGLTLWFGATAPWILRQFWLSQQQLARGMDVPYQKARKQRRRQKRRRAQGEYRAVAIGRRSRFAQPRVAVTPYHWSDELVRRRRQPVARQQKQREQVEELIYETAPSTSADSASTSRVEEMRRVSPKPALAVSAGS